MLIQKAQVKHEFECQNSITSGIIHKLIELFPRIFPVFLHLGYCHIQFLDIQQFPCYGLKLILLEAETPADQRKVVHKQAACGIDLRRVAEFAIRHVPAITPAVGIDCDPFGFRKSLDPVKDVWNIETVGVVSHKNISIIYSDYLKKTAQHILFALERFDPPAFIILYQQHKVIESFRFCPCFCIPFFAYFDKRGVEGKTYHNNRRMLRRGHDSALYKLSLIHISEPTRLGMISYAVFCLKKKKK